MTSNGLRAQYLIPNLSLSAITYPSIRPFRSGHVITQSRKISANSPSTERKQTADRELLYRIFPKKPSFSWTDFLTELGPQIRLLPVPNFGVNSVVKTRQSSHGLTETRQKGHWKIMLNQGGEREKYTHFR
jgi:hypothetical protein